MYYHSCSGADWCRSNGTDSSPLGVPESKTYISLAIQLLDIWSGIDPQMFKISCVQFTRPSLIALRATLFHFFKYYKI